MCDLTIKMSDGNLIESPNGIMCVGAFDLRPSPACVAERAPLSDPGFIVPSRCFPKPPKVLQPQEKGERMSRQPYAVKPGCKFDACLGRYLHLNGGQAQVEEEEEGGC